MNANCDFPIYKKENEENINVYKNEFKYIVYKTFISSAKSYRSDDLRCTVLTLLMKVLRYPIITGGYPSSGLIRYASLILGAKM